VFVNFNILNQLGSPAINSNTFANRPAAGQTGRLFVSNDTFEIYRDNGTTWDLIGGPGSSTITGSGTATQVAYFTSSQAIGSSANLFWDNTNSFLGVGTAVPTAGVHVVDTDAFGMYSQITTVAGTSATSVGIFAKNNTSGSGYAGIFDEATPNSTAGQYPILIRHSLTSGTAGVNMATGIHFGLPDDAGTERINQFSMDTTDAAAATYSSRYRFLLRNAGAAATPFYITGAGIGIYKAAPSGLIHADGGANVARMILDADNNVARIFSFRTDDLQRWAFWVDGNETGTNAGADLQIRRYDDAGTFIDAPVQINRSSGHIGIAGAPSTTETFKVTGNALIEHNYTQTTGVNRNGIFSYLTTTTPNGASYTAGIAYTAMGALHNDIFQGSATIPRTVLAGGFSGQAFIQFNSGPDTVTIQQGLAGQLRSFAAVQANFGFSPSQAGCTVTHASGFHAYAPIYTGANNPTVTNYYGIALNDTTEYSALTITNRWGVYQAGASDLNYMAANLLLGSTVNNGNKLQVTGNADFTGNVGIGTTSPVTNLDVNAAISGAYTTSSSQAVARLYNVTNAGGINSSVISFQASTDGGSSNPVARIGVVGESAGSNNGAMVMMTRDGSGVSERMRITSGGKVGIGLTSNINQSLTILDQGDAESLGIYRNFTGAADAGTIFTLGTTNGSGVPTAAAKLVGVLNGAKTDGYFVIQTVSSSTAQTRMQVESNGNVLIGTTTDAGQKLQVNGTALIGSTLTVGGNLNVDSGDLIINGTASNTIGSGPYEAFVNIANSYQYVLQLNASYGLDFWNYQGSWNNRITFAGDGNISTVGSLTTGAPSGGTAAAWKLGSRVAATVVLDTTQYIELDVGGTLYKLAIVT